MQATSYTWCVTGGMCGFAGVNNNAINVMNLHGEGLGRRLREGDHSGRQKLAIEYSHVC